MHRAIGRHQKLFEVPPDIAAIAFRVLVHHELLVDRVTVLTVDVNLLKEWERHPVRGGTESQDFFGTSRLLTHELVAGKTHHAEAPRRVGSLEVLQPLVLRGETTLRGNVNDEDRLAFIGSERTGFTTQRMYWDLENRNSNKLPDENLPRSPSLKTVHAVTIHRGSLELAERPDPIPGPHEVLVANEFAGINAADLLQRRGLYPSPPGWPVDIPGMELSGRVVAVGEGVDSSLLGRRVCAIVGGGAQSTRALVPAEHLIEVPDNIDLEDAGGFAEAFITAYDALVLQGHFARGERLLGSGASGGVGSAAVQIARLLDAHVTAVTRTPTHHAELLALGADEVITLEDVTSVEPVNVVLELVGAAHLTLAQGRLADFARVVVIGVAGGGSRVEVDLLNVMRTRSTLTGSTLRSRSRDEKTRVIARVRDALVEPWRCGQIKVPLSRTFALADAEDAYSFFSPPGKFGKVLLSIPDGGA